LSGLFYNLGRKVGPKVRKARWMWQSFTGTEADAIKVEYEVGKDLVREVRQQLEHGRTPQTDQLLNEIGNRLTACVANKLRKFSFEAVNGPEPNAFALPGGFVFVTQSLVELCRYDKNEIACILGHEMAHIMRGHAMNRIISNSAIAVASRAAPIRGALSGWLRKVACNSSRALIPRTWNPKRTCSGCGWLPPQVTNLTPSCNYLHGWQS
jgi:Zn-dependent protease with chaperone function